MKLSEYLAQRGIILDPTKIGDDNILNDAEALKEVAGVWKEHNATIKKVLQERVNAIAMRILNNNLPFEGTIYQQAMVEVAAIINDFEKYSAELARRSAPEEGNDNSPTPVEAEGSL